VTTATKKPLVITCSRCKQRRKPVTFRAIFCRPCFEEMVEEANRPKPAPVGVPAGFRRNDFKGDL
jgi:hypothetical protein